MIWGKTTKQRDLERAMKNANWFAWRPVQLADGRWCWWQRICRDTHESWDGGWYSYHLKKS